MEKWEFWTLLAAIAMAGDKFGPMIVALIVAVVFFLRGV